MALRVQNAELAARATEVSRQLGEKEAELAALAALQIGSLEAYKSKEPSPNTSPILVRRVVSQGGGGRTLAPSASLNGAPPPPAWSQPTPAFAPSPVAPIAMRPPVRVPSTRSHQHQRSISHREDYALPPLARSTSIDPHNATECLEPRAPSLGARADTKMEAEEVAARAETHALATSAPLHVEVDNEADEVCTIVRIVAPDRALLLTDLTSALSGLGLSIERASISTVGSQAINTFSIQEVSEHAYHEHAAPTLPQPPRQPPSSKRAERCARLLPGCALAGL